MYTFLHEAGHALTGLLFGQSLTIFDVSFWDLSAHVGMVGGELTQAQLAIRAVAGASLPLLVWVLFISMVPRKASFILESMKLISSMVVVNTLLAWIILPILFLFGKAPSDDVTNFLRYTQMPSLLLTFVGILLYIGAWLLFLSKTNGLRNEFLLFNIMDPEKLAAGTRSTIPVLTGILAFLVIVVLTLNATVDTTNQFSPPPDFSPVAQIDLSTQAYSSETLVQFIVHEPAYVGVFIVIHNINTTYFDLSVTGPDEFHSTVLHGEGYSAFQDGGLWEKNLLPGIYQLVITPHQSPGSVSVYMITP